MDSLLSWLNGKPVEKEKPDLDVVARNLGIPLPLRRPMFNSSFYQHSEDSLRTSLKIALTHSSYINEHPDDGLESNERLEFLGDAILGLVIANELYTKYPDLQEGALTQIRANVVNTKTLARAARNLRLGEHLLLGSGEEKNGGADRDSNLANAFEAVVAAIGIGRGYNGYDAAKDFCLRVLREEIDRAYKEATAPPQQKKPALGGKHPKSALQEISQARYGKTPSYSVLNATGKSNAMTFTVQVKVDGKALGTGKGSGKKAAETEAAKVAIAELMRNG